MRITLAIVALSIAAPAVADGPSIPTAWFVKDPAEVASILANVCADRQAAVVEQDAFHVLCSKQVSGFKGALAQALIGNSASTTPDLKVRFSIIKDGSAIRVQANEWIETQMAFGQMRRQELNGKKQAASLQDLLVNAGGSATRIQAAPTPAPSSSPSP